MKIVAIGDIVVPCELLEEAAHAIAGEREHIVKTILWPCENRQEFQKKSLNLEKNGPTAEKVPEEAYTEICRRGHPPDPLLPRTRRPHRRG